MNVDGSTRWVITLYKRLEIEIKTRQAMRAEDMIHLIVKFVQEIKGNPGCLPFTKNVREQRNIWKVVLFFQMECSKQKLWTNWVAHGNGIQPLFNKTLVKD